MAADLLKVILLPANLQEYYVASDGSVNSGIPLWSATLDGFRGP